MKNSWLGFFLLFAGCSGSKPDLVELDPDRFQCLERFVAAGDRGPMMADAAGNFAPVIPFKSASAQLIDEGRAKLDSIAGFLAGNGNTYRIAVHSDKNGPKEGLFSLSRKRANAIAAYLISKGIAKERVPAVGLGWKCYLGNADSPEDQRKNRRVEFILGVGE